MVSIAELVEQLAVQLPGEEVPGQPLLSQLREAVYGGLVLGSRGGGEQFPMPLNAAAALAFEEIAEEISAVFHGATLIRPNKAPEVNLLAWWAAFSAASARGETTLAQHEVACEKLERWAGRISALLDPPRVKLLSIACPVCGLWRVTVGEGELEEETDAVIVEIRRGEPLLARCQNPSCAGVWVGTTEVIHLGRLAGVEIDPDAIREALTPDTPSAENEPAEAGEDVPSDSAR